jgi:hypothetical protein
MKVIFLDVDGVLNSTRSFVASKYTDYIKSDVIGPTVFHNHQNHDPIAIGLVNKLCDNDDIKIVVSSTWRLVGEEGVIKDLRAMGITGDFATPAITIQLTDIRGEEVNDWLKNHGTKNNVTHHVILDDGSDFYPSQPHVKSNIDIGFSYKNYLEAKKYLGLNTFNLVLP